MPYPVPLLIPLFRSELELCGIKSGENVAIISENGARADYAAAFQAAALDLGATVFNVDVPALPSQSGVREPRARGLTAQPLVVDALKRCDLVIDLVRLLWSKVQTDILATGPRMITCHEPVEVLARLFPTRERRSRVEAAGRLLGAARVLRVTSASGTDLTYQVGMYSVLLQYGYSDTRGRWDHFASALAATAADDDGVDGVLVLSPGDLLLPFKRYVINPVRLTIRRGRIEAIEGDGEAALLRSYLASYDDERAYAISHVGWGLNENAKWDALAVDTSANGIENRSFNGSVMFSTGPNTELGGNNDTACHIDIPMRGCSLYVDGVAVVLNDEIVHSEIPEPSPTGGRVRV